MFNAMYFYRIARKLYLLKIPVLPRIIKLIIFILYNSILPYEADIGKGTMLGYGGIGVVIHKKARIGENCLISQQVTIGGKQGYEQVPNIGNNVDIGAGAKIIGPVKIGDNVTIGANAVVVKDIPDNAIIAGIPARIIRIKENINN